MSIFAKHSSMNKKSVYLIIALVLPVSIFVFLKLTGKNQFDIPIYYANGIDSLTTICKNDYAKPYHIADSILARLKWQPKECSIFILGNSNQIELKRLNDVFSNESYGFYSIGFEPEIDEIVLNAIDFDKWRNCIFVINEKMNVVLMDKEKRIRGYYSIGSREEMDRLIVEMKILLKQY